ncbi:unnamed protein product, partial [Rotaria magnacalcarata]
MEDSTTTE